MIETNITSEKQKEDLLKRMAYFIACCYDESIHYYQIKQDNPKEALVETIEGLANADA